MDNTISNATLNGLSELQQLGLAGIFLSFIFIMGITAIWYFARHCEKKSDAALQAYKDEVKETRDVVNKNTDAFNGVKVALVRLEGKVN